MVAMTKNSLDDLKSVAGDVIEERPDWDLTATLNVLLAHRDKPLGEIRTAALKAARTARSWSPAAINFPEHWAKPKSTTPPGVGAGYNPLPECRTCGDPASRECSARLLICPGCGEAWDPVIFRHGVNYRGRQS